ncbi:MAG: hypothetical protein ACRYGI_16735 [Janthinobacterium lividum]
MSSGAGSTTLSDRPAHQVWPDDRFHRLAAFALLEELRVALLTEASATATLEHWCGTHGIGDTTPGTPAHVTAERDPSVDHALASTDRERLEVGPDERIGYRHVRLVCGGQVLSEADNWYVTGRLTPEMNHRLDTTDIPFGHVVRALNFSRTTVSSELLWSPLPDDWAKQANAANLARQALAVPTALIRNRAILRRHDGRPFSIVIETYQRGLLEFPAPPAR